MKFVKQKYEKRGWRVKSVEANKCGYDLECTKGKQKQCVEVKGVQGNQFRFVITEGEVQQARSNKQFRLYVVTNALSKPNGKEWPGKELDRLFELQPLQYKAILKTTKR